MPTFKIFYSWQSDLPGNRTRYFIRDCLDEAIDLAEESEAIEAERDEATKGMTGSPDIVSTLFSKIDACDFFIADISLCFTEAQKNEKKSPNPNVMLELGYAVKTLGWERVLCICNVDYGEAYPFDIAHNRITRYSLDGKVKKEVAYELAKIIFTNIRDIRKLKPRAKAGMATHIVGTYNFEQQTVFADLSPIDIANQEGYILHNQELYSDAQQLVAEIQSISVKTEGIVANTSTVSPVLTDQATASPSLQGLFEKFSGTETPVLWKEDDLNSATIKHWLGIEVSDTFFDLGGLKRVMSALNISESSLKGTKAEIKKYNYLRELQHKIMHLHMRTDYLKTFKGVIFIPLAIQNISTVQDDNIRVVVNVNSGEIIEPDEGLIWSELEGLQGILCRDDDDEDSVGVIGELFMLPEDGVIHTEDIPYDPRRNKPTMPIFTAHGPAWPERDEEDYALELQEFIATTEGRGYYEFEVDTLRPGECKWLCCGLLVRPIDGNVNLSYRIHSSHSTGDITGSLEWHTR